MPETPTPAEIREAFSDFQREWREIQEEGRTDMRFVAGDPWDAKDRKAREDAGRPCISLDQINQYTNQTINNFRQNKRAIQVTPEGAGADDKSANKLANLIRGIEYKSKAQQAYETAGENMVNRSYGFVRITTDYVAPDSFDQEIRIKRFANPDVVLPDPSFREADGADTKRLFVLEVLRKEEYRKKYPKARVTSFSGEHMIEAPGWIDDKNVQVAEYWMVHTDYRKLLLITTPDGQFTAWEDELKAERRRGPNGKLSLIHI